MIQSSATDWSHLRSKLQSIGLSGSVGFDTGDNNPEQIEKGFKIGFESVQNNPEENEKRFEQVGSWSGVV